jgi:hypothetical protein
MSEQSVTGVYNNILEAKEAIRMFDKGNFPITQVSIVAQDMQSKKEVHGYMSAGDVAKAGANTGRWFGGIFILLVGAAFIWVPSFGPFDRIPYP